MRMQGPMDPSSMNAAHAPNVPGAAPSTSAHDSHAGRDEPSTAFPGFGAPAYGPPRSHTALQQMNPAQALRGLPLGHNSSTSSNSGSSGLPGAQMVLMQPATSGNQHPEDIVKTRDQVPSPIGALSQAARVHPSLKPHVPGMWPETDGAFGSPLELPSPPTPIKHRPDKAQASPAHMPRLIDAAVQPSSGPSSAMPLVVQPEAGQRRRHALSGHHTVASTAASGQLDAATQELQAALLVSESRHEQAVALLASHTQEIQLLRHEAAAQQATIANHELCAQQASQASALHEHQASADMDRRTRQLEKVTADAAGQRETHRQEMARLATLLKETETKLKERELQHAAANEERMQLQQVLQQKDASLRCASEQLRVEAKKTQELKLAAVSHRDVPVFLNAAREEVQKLRRRLEEAEARHQHASAQLGHVRTHAKAQHQVTARYDQEVQRLQQLLLQATNAKC